MENFIIIAVVLLIVGLATMYIIKEKKKGVKCIGCPSAGSCAHKCGADTTVCNCGNEAEHCGTHTDKMNK